MEATDGCTPRLGPNKEVKVDGVRYRISSARTAQSVGGEFFEEKADGTFLILRITAANDRKESSTLTDDVMSIEANGKTFKSDLEGTTALQLSGNSDEEPFFLRDINPDTTTKGVVVFDVPDSVLSGKTQVRFNELGFGSTHGYLALPNVSN